MKKFATICLAGTMLFGCSNQFSQPENSSVVMVNNVKIALNSDLWINNMPSIGSSSEKVLHGSLHLNAKHVLPEGLKANRLVIQQGDKRWSLSEEQLELRSNNENQWDVVFAQPLDVNDSASATVSLQVSENGDAQWLVEKEVQIEAVY